MTRKQAWIALGVALAAVALVLAVLRLRGGEAVRIVQAAQATVAMRVVGPGTVQARVPVTLSARITATVSRLEADVGDAVKRGQVLAQLDDRDLTARRGVVGSQQESLVLQVEAARAAVAKAEADLDLARSRQRRDADLLRSGFVSQSVLDASEAALRGAGASLDNARALLAARAAEVRALAQEARYSDTVLSFTRIVAPMDGVVILRQVEPGTTVVPGTPIFRLADPATLWVAMRVDESVVARVEAGQVASIRLRTGERASGKVARIARLSDAATRELEVHVSFDRPPQRFAIDQEAEVTIQVGQESGLVVPVTAIARGPDGAAGVLVVSEGRAVFRPVETGPADANGVIVRKGLAAGDKIVARAKAVAAGARVRALAGDG